jgi:hypothetical protein
MMRWQELFQGLFKVKRVAQSTLVVVSLATVVLTSLTFSADARGVHGFGRGFGGGSMHGAQFAGDRRHGNDAYTDAASDETDKLLNSKLKSICRGC